MVVLETSVALAYLNGEPERPIIERLVELAEEGRIGILMSDFAWREIDNRDSHDKRSHKRLLHCAQHLPKVARVGEWVLGADVLGHDSSGKIEQNLAPFVGRSRPDVEQFLSYCAQADVHSFFVTKDKGFLKETAKKLVHETYAFRVGMPSDCLDWLKERAIT